MTKGYALYKGDTFLTMGTIEEIAKQMGVEPKTIAFYKTNTYKKRCKNFDNRRILISVDVMEMGDY